MIIVSGTIRTTPGQRQRFLDASLKAMTMARAAQGCMAFIVAADPIVDDLVNVYEQWESEAAMLAFRGDGPSDEMGSMIAHTDVQRHQVSATGPA